MRSTLHLLLGAGFVATLAGCNTTAPAPSAAGPMGSASMSHDCKMPMPMPMPMPSMPMSMSMSMPMPMHASGVDRPMPMMKSMSCPEASKPANHEGAAPRDDHQH